jgi:hypothetical protein
MQTYLLRAGEWQEALGQCAAISTAAALVVTQSSQAAAKRAAEEAKWKAMLDALRTTADAYALELVTEAACVAKALEDNFNSSNAAEDLTDAAAMVTSVSLAAALVSSELQDAHSKIATLESVWQGQVLERRTSYVQPRHDSGADGSGLLASVAAAMLEAEEARWLVSAAQTRARAATTARFLLMQQMASARSLSQSESQARTLRAELRSAEAAARSSAASVLVAAEDLIALQSRIGNEALWAQKVAALRRAADLDGQLLLAAQAAQAEALATDPYGSESSEEVTAARAAAAA